MSTICVNHHLFEIMELLKYKGAKISYSDPHVLNFPKMRNHSFDLSSVELTPEILKSYDAVILATDHDKFDYDLILNNAQIIIDTRGQYRGYNENVFKA